MRREALFTIWVMGFFGVIALALLAHSLGRPTWIYYALAVLVALAITAYARRPG